jgi:hypothetical protein
MGSRSAAKKAWATRRRKMGYTELTQTVSPSAAEQVIRDIAPIHAVRQGCSVLVKSKDLPKAKKAFKDWYRRLGVKPP